MGRYSEPLKIGVGEPFLTQSSTRTMAADETDIVTQRQKLVANGRHQLLVVSARQVRAPHRSREQHVADMGEVLVAVVIYDVAGRMARAMIDFEDMIPEGYPVAVLEPFVRCDVPKTANAIFFGLRLNPFEQRTVVLMRPDDRQRQLFTISFSAMPFSDTTWRMTSTSPPGSTTTPSLVS
jgi:hypothetical protein